MSASVIQVVPKENRFTDVVPKSQDVTITKRKRRPARRQTDTRKSTDGQPPQTGQIFNIWYGKWSGGDREDQLAVKDHAETKCDPERDSGWTKGDKKTGSFFCLFFARGCCPDGPDCQYLHRLPQATDMYSPNVDCFGRDKHADYRDDMGGVGSFLRQNHTLYVGQITTTEDIEEAVATAFCQWGEVERIRVLNSRGVAFVTYVHQNSAEFAKEAMAQQSLNNNEVLNVRWATQDPNPQAAARDARRAEEQAAIAIRRALPKEFLDELEGRGIDKKKRLDYGLEGYQPSDEIWYQRGIAAVNPAGRTKGEGESEPLQIEAPVGDVKKDADTGLIKGRALEALKALKVKAVKPTTSGTTAWSSLVAYGSDEEDDS
ncbi:protein of unknown function [Taphrina deformans PYCC 5710]|uniref:Pre-mRNA-splicing factor cwc2 n=1 Tax=Taphrina deformans (strain PYCC 5710 / ATCC 11124 / CBS 356.35 / IMI 108563 / JCM 9778 / NBRC 8474) TaxID=1097556 RepID=R4XG74_TAPDE|nr:protein of unknown function [Taphrina deformans PYCC 5710]|eukprot:CCG84745.1 protein of unknown function [Taphrina deformans PYCC 5710]